MARLAAQLVEAASERGIELTGADGLLTALTPQVLESALEAEMAAHLATSLVAHELRRHERTRLRLWCFT
jgi:putative transposase